MNNHACLVCLGSNKESEMHLQNAHWALLRLFRDVQFGKAVRTKAEGSIRQPDYLNQAARFKTDLPPHKVVSLLKEIEKENGRQSADKQQGLVPLDIDLLQYDSHVLRPADMAKDYVQRVLNELY